MHPQSAGAQDHAHGHAHRDHANHDPADQDRARQHPAEPSRRELNASAVRATLHCLTGCAIGEVLGLVIGTALGWSNGATIALAVALAFLFGYAFTFVPVLRSGVAARTAVGVTLAADTVSITVMEILDNAVMLVVPGAMHTGLDSAKFWGSLAFAFAVAFVLTVPVNRALIRRGRGHAVVHRYH
ncbi:MAG: DUF4396 domain-containing protein [Sporichthyaceae bacterium]